MSIRNILISLLICSGLVLCHTAVTAQSKKEPPKKGGKKNAGKPKQDGKPSLNDISMEVAALQTVQQLQLTTPQMEKLKALARETAEKPRRRDAPRTSKEFRQKLEALHKALIEGGDADELQDEVDELREKENPTLDDDFELTEAARRRAPEFLKQLKAGQLHNFLAENADVADPLDKLMEALQEVRDWKDAEWKDKRDQLADDVATLIAGVDKGKFKKAHEQATALLNRARGLDPKELKAQLPKLHADAQKIVGTIHPLDVLRHFTEYNLAELLSNPRLDAALRARLKAAK